MRLCVLCVCAYIHVCVCAFLCVSVCACIFVYVCAYMCTRVCMCVYVCVFMYLCMCVHVLFVCVCVCVHSNITRCYQGNPTHTYGKLEASSTALFIISTCAYTFAMAHNTIVVAKYHWCILLIKLQCFRIPGLLGKHIVTIQSVIIQLPSNISL